jgi:hypothetical protein
MNVAQVLDSDVAQLFDAWKVECIGSGRARIARGGSNAPTKAVIDKSRAKIAKPGRAPLASGCTAPCSGSGTFSLAVIRGQSAIQHLRRCVVADDSPMVQPDRK